MLVLVQWLMAKDNAQPLPVILFHLRERRKQFGALKALEITELFNRHARIRAAADVGRPCVWLGLYLLLASGNSRNRNHGNNRSNRSAGGLLQAKKHQTASDRDQAHSADNRKRKIASHVMNPRPGAEKLIGAEFVSTLFVENAGAAPRRGVENKFKNGPQRARASTIAAQSGTILGLHLPWVNTVYQGRAG